MSVGSESSTLPREHNSNLIIYGKEHLFYATDQSEISFFLCHLLLNIEKKIKFWTPGR